VGELRADGLDLGVRVRLDVGDGLDAEVVAPLGPGEMRGHRDGPGSAEKAVDRETHATLLVDEGVRRPAAIPAAVPPGVACRSSGRRQVGSSRR
jgi:hypothetical protein